MPEPSIRHSETALSVGELLLENGSREKPPKALES